MRTGLGTIFRNSAEQRESQIEEDLLMLDPVRTMTSMPTERSDGR